MPATISLRYSRRNGVPPISTLLESADRSVPLPPPPPPVPHSRNYYNLEQRERRLRDSLDDLHAQASRLRRDAQDFVQGNGDHRDDPWTETERRTLLETAAAAQLHRPGLRRSRTFNTQREPAHIAISSEPHSAAEPSEHDRVEAPRTVLPTPPLDQSEPDGDSLFLPEGGRATSRPLHPLSRSWRPDSPVNGLGDRNRSPTPQDAWEIIETTIPPDAHLPSADSSFAPAAISFNSAASNDTTITEPERESASGSSRRRSREDEDEEDDDTGSDSASSVDPDDLACTEEEYISEAENFARDMYYHEMQSPEGRARIARLHQQVNHRFAPDQTPTEVDIGFRLMHEAFDSDEGRERFYALHGDDAIHRLARFREPQSRGSPPRATTSHEPPLPNPVSPPLRDVSDALLNDLDSDEQDLDQMRRVARRLAQRDDVPDDWWMSMGLNSSIARPRQRRRSPDGVRRSDMIERTRGGRVDRGNSRL